MLRKLDRQILSEVSSGRVHLCVACAGPFALGDTRDPLRQPSARALRELQITMLRDVGSKTTWQGAFALVLFRPAGANELRLGWGKLYGFEEDVLEVGVGCQGDVPDLAGQVVGALALRL